VHDLTRHIPRTIATAACIAGLALIILPAPEGVRPDMQTIAGIVVLSVGLWSTAVLPEYYTGVIFMALAVAVAGTERDIVFSGFHSSAAWMIFGGLIIALAVQTTGLGARIADMILARMGQSYLAIITGTVFVAVFMVFVMPSNTGRVMIMLPIFLALADRLGFAEGGNGRAAIAMAVGAGNIYPSFAVLPAGVANQVMLGAAESIHGMRITYGDYLLTQFPVIALVSIVALPLVLRYMFPDTPRAAHETTERRPLTPEEARLLIILSLTLALWITDFAHGIMSAWIALGAAVACMMPRIGMLAPSAMVREINLAPWFYVAAVVGMGAVVANSGLGEWMANGLLSVIALSPGHDFTNFTAVSLMGVVVGWAVTVPGAPAIMTSFAATIAEATGWPLKTVVLAQPITWAMSLFPYQLPPIVLIIALGGVRIGQAVRVLAAMALITCVVMLPLQYLWWRALGMFG